MNKLIIILTGNLDDKINYPLEGVSDNQIISKLVAIGKDDDNNNTLTYGVDTENPNRPITSVKGKIYVNRTYSNYLDYILIKYPNLVITSGETYVYFEDPEVERVLVEKISSDGISITTSDVLNTTKLALSLFRNNTIILTFNELNLFSNIILEDYCFHGCSSLSSINLSTVSLIGTSCFHGTSSLTGNINIPNLTSLGGYSSFERSSITTVSNLGHVISIPERTFSQCSNLTSVILPLECITIGPLAFAGCSLLLEVTNLDNIVTIYYRAFGYDCPLPNIINFKSLTTIIGDTSNYGGTSTVHRYSLGLKSPLYIYMPKITFCEGGFDTGNNSVSGLFCTSGFRASTGPKNIVYFKDLLSIKTGFLCGSSVRNLVINNVSPPTVSQYDISSDKFVDSIIGSTLNRSTILNVYVPAEAVSIYNSTPYWQDLNIKSINSLNKVATKELFDLLPDLEKPDTLIEEYM